MNSKTNMISTVFNFVADRKNLMRFWLYGMLFLDSVIRFLTGGQYEFIRTVLFRWLIVAWTVLILLNDLRLQRWIKEKTVLALDAFLVICVISYLYNWPSSLPLLIGQIMYCHIFYSIPLFYKKEEFFQELNRFFNIFVITTFFLSLISLVLLVTKMDFVIPFFTRIPYSDLFFNDGPHAFGGANRYHGLYTHAVPGSLECCLSIAASCYLLKGRKINKFFFSFNLLVQLVMIYLSDTRTAFLYLILFAALLLFDVLRNKVGTKVAVFSSLCTILVLLGILFLLKRNHFEQVLASLSTDFYRTLDAYSSGRLEIWTTCIQSALRHPLLGDGWYNNTASYNIGYPFAHNAFVNIFVYTGILGLIAIIVFIGLYIHELCKAKEKRDTILSAIVLCILLESLFENILIGEMSHIETGLFWLLLGYTAFADKFIPSEDTSL